MGSLTLSMLLLLAVPHGYHTSRRKAEEDARRIRNTRSVYVVAVGGSFGFGARNIMTGSKLNIKIRNRYVPLFLGQETTVVRHMHHGGVGPRCVGSLWERQ